MENNSSSKVLDKKRLIAEMIFKITALGTISSAIAMFAITVSINNDVKALRSEQSSIYSTFQSSPEFEQLRQNEAQNIAEAYVGGKISYDEYITQISRLGGNNFATEVFNQLASAELKDSIAQKDVEITNLEKYSKRAKAKDAIWGTAVASTAACITSGLLEIAYEEKYKKSLLVVIKDPIPNEGRKFVYNQQLCIVTLPEMIPAGTHYDPTTDRYFIPEDSRHNNSSKKVKGKTNLHQMDDCTNQTNDEQTTKL